MEILALRHEVAVLRRTNARPRADLARLSTPASRPLGIAESGRHGWKSWDLLDRGLRLPNPQQVVSAELAGARARIAELETEVKILRKAAAAVEQVVAPQARFALVTELG